MSAISGVGSSSGGALSLANNLASLRANRNATRDVNSHLTKLSTGLKINKASDGPSQLIGSENLRANLAAIEAAGNNLDRAGHVVQIADGGRTEIGNLLNEGLRAAATLEGSFLSDAERDALQATVSSITGSINRIANQTSFQDQKLLNGEFEFQNSNVDNAVIDDVIVNQTPLPDGGIDVAVEVQQGATTGAVFVSGNAGGTAFTNGTVTLEVGGADGTQQFAFASGTTAAQAAQSINTNTDLTGVSATDLGNGNIQINSTGVGDSEFVSVRLVDGPTDFEDNISDQGLGVSGGSGVTDFGEEAVVTINGVEAAVDGNRASLSNTNLDITVILDDPTTTASTQFHIDSGGARFSLGPDAELQQKANVNFRGATSGVLGLHDSSISLQERFRSAIVQNSTERARLGSFIKDQVGTSRRNLDIQFENTTRAESNIRDTDFANRTSLLASARARQQASQQAQLIGNQQQSNSILSLFA